MGKEYDAIRTIVEHAQFPRNSSKQLKCLVQTLCLTELSLPVVFNQINKYSAGVRDSKLMKIYLKLSKLKRQANARSRTH